MDFPCTQLLSVPSDDETDSITEVHVADLIVGHIKYPVFTGINRIGRDSSKCSIILQDQTISLEHAVIEVDSDREAEIYDLGSSNKTWLGKRIIKPHVRYALEDGAFLKFANVEAHFALFELAAETPRHVRPSAPTPLQVIPESPDNDSNDSLLGATIETADKGEVSPSLLDPEADFVPASPELPTQNWASEKPTARTLFLADSPPPEQSEESIHVLPTPARCVLKGKQTIADVSTSDDLREVDSPCDSSEADFHDLPTQKNVMLNDTKDVDSDVTDAEDEIGLGDDLFSQPTQKYVKKSNISDSSDDIKQDTVFIDNFHDQPTQKHVKFSANKDADSDVTDAEDEINSGDDFYDQATQKRVDAKIAVKSFAKADAKQNTGFGDSFYDQPTQKRVRFSMAENLDSDNEINSASDVRNEQIRKRVSTEVDFHEQLTQKSNIANDLDLDITDVGHANDSTDDIHNQETQISKEITEKYDFGEDIHELPTQPFIRPIDNTDNSVVISENHHGDSTDGIHEQPTQKYVKPIVANDLDMDLTDGEIVNDLTDDIHNQPTQKAITKEITEKYDFGEDIHELPTQPFVRPLSTANNSFVMSENHHGDSTVDIHDLPTQPLINSSVNDAHLQAIEEEEENDLVDGIHNESTLKSITTDKIIDTSAKEDIDMKDEVQNQQTLACTSSTSKNSNESNPKEDIDIQNQPTEKKKFDISLFTRLLPTTEEFLRELATISPITISDVDEYDNLDSSGEDCLPRLRERNKRAGLGSESPPKLPRLRIGIDSPEKKKRSVVDKQAALKKGTKLRSVKKKDVASGANSDVVSSSSPIKNQADTANPPANSPAKKTISSKNNISDYADIESDLTDDIHNEPTQEMFSPKKIVALTETKRDLVLEDVRNERTQQLNCSTSSRKTSKGTKLKTQPTEKNMVPKKDEKPYGSQQFSAETSATASSATDSEVDDHNRKDSSCLSDESVTSRGRVRRKRVPYSPEPPQKRQRRGGTTSSDGGKVSITPSTSTKEKVAKPRAATKRDIDLQEGAAKSLSVAGAAPKRISAISAKHSADNAASNSAKRSRGRPRKLSAGDTSTEMECVDTKKEEVASHDFGRDPVTPDLPAQGKRTKKGVIVSSDDEVKSVSVAGAAPKRISAISGKHSADNAASNSAKRSRGRPRKLSAGDTPTDMERVDTKKEEVASHEFVRDLVTPDSPARGKGTRSRAATKTDVPSSDNADNAVGNSAKRGRGRPRKLSASDTSTKKEPLKIPAKLPLVQLTRVTPDMWKVSVDETSKKEISSPPAKRKRGANVASVSPRSKRKTTVAAKPVDETPRRSVRKSYLSSTELITPRVLFTGLDDTDQLKILTRLGGLQASSADDCSVLVTDRVRRTTKFLSCVGRSIPIVSPNWLLESSAKNKFLDPWNFILSDLLKENEFGFSLTEALEAARAKKLLAGYTVFATPSVRPPPAEMKGIVESCGARYLARVPKTWAAQSLVVTCDEDKGTWLRYKGAALIVTPEFVLAGCLRQELDLTQNVLKV